METQWRKKERKERKQDSLEEIYLRFVFVFFWFLPRQMKGFLITHLPLDSVRSSVWALVSATAGQEVSVIIIDFQSRMSPSGNSRPMPSFYNWRNWGTEFQGTQKPQLLDSWCCRWSPKICSYLGHDFSWSDEEEKPQKKDYWGIRNQDWCLRSQGWLEWKLSYKKKAILLKEVILLIDFLGK